MPQLGCAVITKVCQVRQVGQANSRWQRAHLAVGGVGLRQPSRGVQEQPPRTQATAHLPAVRP
jgi:hypothetical protein